MTLLKNKRIDLTVMNNLDIVIEVEKAAIVIFKKLRGRVAKECPRGS